MVENNRNKLYDAIWKVWQQYNCKFTELSVLTARRMILYPEEDCISPVFDNKLWVAYSYLDAASVSDIAESGTTDIISAAKFFLKKECFNLLEEAGKYVDVEE